MKEMRRVWTDRDVEICERCKKKPATARLRIEVWPLEEHELAPGCADGAVYPLAQTEKNPYCAFCQDILTRALRPRTRKMKAAAAPTA